MRTLIFLFFMCALMGCKSQKDVTVSESVKTDSLAYSGHHRTILTIDSVVRSIDFSFDTLKINVERHYKGEARELPCKQDLGFFGVGSDKGGNVSRDVIRLTATKGRVIGRRSVYRDSVEASNRIDTVSYKKSVAEDSTEHTAATRLYDPPDGTAVAVVALIIAGVLVYLFLRKK